MKPANPNNKILKVFEPFEPPRYSGGVCGLGAEFGEDEGLAGTEAYFDEAIRNVRCERIVKLAFYSKKKKAEKIH